LVFIIFNEFVGLLLMFVPNEFRCERIFAGSLLIDLGGEASAGWRLICFFRKVQGKTLSFEFADDIGLQLDSILDSLSGG